MSCTIPEHASKVKTLRVHVNVNLTSLAPTVRGLQSIGLHSLPQGGDG